LTTHRPTQILEWIPVGTHRPTQILEWITMGAQTHTKPNKAMCVPCKLS
jgi:hypothetical protein